MTSHRKRSSFSEHFELTKVEVSKIVLIGGIVLVALVSGVSSYYLGYHLGYRAGLSNYAKVTSTKTSKSSETAKSSSTVELSSSETATSEEDTPYDTSVYVEADYPFSTGYLMLVRIDNPDNKLDDAGNEYSYMYTLYSKNEGTFTDYYRNDTLGEFTVNVDSSGNELE